MMFPIKYNGDVLHHNARVGVDGGIVESLDFVNDLSEQTKRVNMPLLLDIYPNAAAAYSLRKLRTAYTGAAIRVRRSSDNTETDIGFNNAGDLDTSALAAFVGNGNGFVSTWYDQSGNNRNATQNSTTEQPVAVSGGTIISENNKSSLSFNGINSRFDLPSIPFQTNSLSVLTVLKSNSNISNGVALSHPDNIRIYPGFILNSVDYYGYVDSATKFNLGVANVNQNLYSLYVGLVNANAYRNGIASVGVTSLSSSSTGEDWSIGSYLKGSTASYYNGEIQEIIIYTTDRTANRIGIETNINSYYKIYQQEALLLDYYPDAAAAYSLRKLRSGYTGAAIQVRRSSDNAVQNIGFDSNGGLDVTALTSFVGTGNTGFVSTWYDQSGNNRNATQTTQANQPIVVSGGTTINENNKPSLLWHSSSVSLPLSDLSLTKNINNFYSTVVARNNLNTATSGRWMFLHSVNGADGSRALLGISSPLVNYRTGGRRLDADAFQGADSSVVDDLRLKLYTSHLNYGNSDAFLWVNNSLVASNTNFLTDGNTADTLSKGSQIGNNNSSGEGWRGTIQELIHYTSNQSTNRPFIEANINSYYNIYPTDSDANAFVTAAGLTGTTQIQAVNKLVTDLKGYGLWGKMKAIYPFVGGTASSHKFNLKDPRDVDGAFRLVFNGTWTHTTGGATSGFGSNATTYFVPETNAIRGNRSFGVYTRSTNPSALISSPSSTNSSVGDFIRPNDPTFRFGQGYNATTITSPITAAGFYYMSRVPGGTYKQTIYLNGNLIGTGSADEQTAYLLTNSTVIEGSLIAFSYISEGLTDNQMVNLYTAVQTFQTTLGRQV